MQGMSTNLLEVSPHSDTVVTTQPLSMDTGVVTGWLHCTTVVIICEMDSVFASSLWKNKEKGRSKTNVMYMYFLFGLNGKLSVSFTSHWQHPRRPLLSTASPNGWAHKVTSLTGMRNGSEETGSEPLDLVGNKLAPVKSTSSESTLRVTDHAGVFSAERQGSPLEQHSVEAFSLHLELVRRLRSNTQSERQSAEQNEYS